MLEEQGIEQGQPGSAQQEFDELTQRKIELWEQIKDKALYELTEQWKEIESVDRQLFVLKAQIEGGNA